MSWVWNPVKTLPTPPFYPFLLSFLTQPAVQRSLNQFGLEITLFIIEETPGQYQALPTIVYQVTCGVNDIQYECVF